MNGTVKISFEVECETCGSALSADVWGDVIKVEPCQQCIADAVDAVEPASNG